MTRNPSRLHVGRRTLLLAPVLLAITVALAVWMVATVWAAWPTGPTYLPQATSQMSGNLKSGDHPDFEQTFDVPIGDVNYDAVAWYYPPEFGIARDEDVPDGTKMGFLESSAVIGINAGQSTCNVPVTPKFDLLDATTTGTCFPSTGDENNGDWNGYDKTCPGGKERAICEYPCFLDALFPTRPIARYSGHKLITTGVHANLTFLVFEPGTSLGYGIPSTASWGYPVVTVLNETGAPREARISSLADFCTPMSTHTIIYGTAGGVAIHTNPQCGGTYTFRLWSRGQPDKDGDGLENAFDTCPNVANQMDPRVQTDAGDTDSDGIDNACDTVLSAPADIDQDRDGYPNRQDNCPLVPNGCNTVECSGIFNPDWDNQHDADADGIGDACDTNPNVDGQKIIPPVMEFPVDIEGPDCAAGTATPTPTATPAATGTVTVTATVTGGTTLAASATAGDTTISVADASGLAVGDTITIGSGTTAETCKITAISGSTLTLDCTLESDHAAGETVVKAAVATPTATVPGIEDICPPVIPGTYNGLVRLNGVPAPSGYEVIAKVADKEWGSAIVSGGRYAMDIPGHLSAAPPCFEAGALAFEINGAKCTTTPTADTFVAGLQNVDLACAAAATATPTPAATTPAASPTKTATATATATATTTPAKPPPSGGGGLGGDQGLPLWALALAGWSSLMALAGLGTLARRIVKR